MQTFISAAVLTLLLATGCVSPRTQIVLDPVGPAPARAGTSLREGTLVVFSAPDTYPHFNGVPYHIYYTDYKLNSTDGILLKEIHNDSGTTMEGPTEVNLAPIRSQHALQVMDWSPFRS